jgi:tetratricopeptide (TPR) repeat protein
LIKSVILLVISTIACISLQAQDDQALAKATTVQKAIRPIDEKVTTDSITDKNLLPLFGETEKNTKEKEADRIFVGMCSKNFPNLIEASKFFADRGWEYLAEGELDTATHRFNLCYLLNAKNADAYWGLGVITFQKGDLDKAANILKKGVMADSTNSSLMVDLATVELSCFEKNNHQKDLAEAHDLLAKAIDLDPSNVLGWQKRSETEYYLENYENAWECIHSARLLDISKIDLIFVGKLSEKMKDPKGVFKF